MNNWNIPRKELPGLLEALREVKAIQEGKAEAVSDEEWAEFKAG